MSSSTTLSDDRDNGEDQAVATTTVKERTPFPCFLIKAVEKSKSHQRNLEGEKVLLKLLKMAKVAGYDHTFKHGMKVKWINKVFETAFELDGNLNG